MELKLVSAAPNETILTELYGWGEVPFDWINERGAEYTNIVDLRKLQNNDAPIIMQSVYNGKDTSWQALYFMPSNPTPEENDLVQRMRLQLEKMPESMFKIVYTHDGIECHAFM